MNRTTGRMFGTVALATALAGCGASSPASEPAPAPPTVRTVAPAPVPAPAGKQVLKLTGAVSNRNRGSSLVFDQLALDAMASETATLHEPFLKKNIAFTGIPMSVLLSRAGIATGASSVEVHALDDYKVTFKVADLMAPGVLLATRANGAPIPVANGGPIRLVFPPDSAAGRNRDVWIWSIDSMTVS